MSNDIGRNSPCPCGSGLKFKKCCLNDPHNLFPTDTPERRHHWSPEEISQLPTDKIIEKLGMCGIPFSEGEFLIDVHNHLGSCDIHKEWERRFKVTATGFDMDFPWMAADVLWRRLAPEKISTEQLDDWMHDGYELIETRDDVVGCRLWLKVWDHLKPRFTKEMRTVEQAESVFQGSQCLFNWCQDLEMELGNAAIDEASLHLERIKYCREFLDYFPESEYFVQEMGKARAESLILSGKVEEGEKEFQDLIAKYPRNVWFYIYWGDLYACFGVGKFRQPNPKKAEELYRKGLGLDPKEDETIQDRIRRLKQG